MWENGEINTNLADIVKLNYGHTVGVWDGILKEVESELLSEKFFGINTYGAVVNLGTKDGTVKLLIDSVNEQLGEDKKCDGYMTVVHCIAHN